MKRGKIFFVLAVLLLFSGMAFSSDIKLLKESDVQALCDRFMSRLNTNGVNSAFSLMRRFSTLNDGEYEKLRENANKLFSSLEPSFGKSIGYVLVDKKNLSNVLIRLVYVQKFEKYPLRWSFYFYRGRNEWIFNEFNIDNKFEEMFK